MEWKPIKMDSAAAWRARRLPLFAQRLEKRLVDALHFRGVVVV